MQTPRFGTPEWRNVKELDLYFIVFYWVHPFVDTVTVMKLPVPQNTGISWPDENQQGPQEGFCSKE